MNQVPSKEVNSSIRECNYTKNAKCDKVTSTEVRSNQSELRFGENCANVNVAEVSSAQLEACNANPPTFHNIQQEAYHVTAPNFLNAIPLNSQERSGIEYMTFEETMEYLDINSNAFSNISQSRNPNMRPNVSPLSTHWTNRQRVNSQYKIGPSRKSYDLIDCQFNKNLAMDGNVTVSRNEVQKPLDSLVQEEENEINSTAPSYISSLLEHLDDHEARSKSQETATKLIKSEFPNSLPLLDKTSCEMLIETNVHPEVQNIVTTASMNCALDLKKITMHTLNVEYNPERFAAMVMRKRNPRTTALIFSNGKIVCTGAKSIEESRKSIRRYARTIQRCGYNPKLSNLTVQNIVGSCKVGFLIKLETLYGLLPGCYYEPEIFPGLVYRIIRFGVVALIFRSGSIIFTGAKNVDDLNQAFKYTYPMLENERLLLSVQSCL